jgi:Uncharacterized protein conserved in bacteria (DUF2188)
MPNLPRFTLGHDRKNDDWALKEEVTGRTVRRFGTKGEATKGGVLEKAVGSKGGSVRIQKANGVFQEERTYPRSRDPRESEG